MNSTRSGIIDIGSNSVRLVIYEQIAQSAHRVIDESKHSARLSEKVAADGTIPLDRLDPLVRILNDFRLLCQAHGVGKIRAVATAAVRNAVNSDAIVARLEQETGFSIQVLSGEEEAQLGFIGMINTIDVSDGFVIDIGGGSTEISLFTGRRVLHSVSLPFGAVNMAKRFATPEDGSMGPEQAKKLVEAVEQALTEEPWLRGGLHLGLPLVGLGGTVRSLCKIDQKARKYALDTAHNYEMTADSVEKWLDKLAELPPDKRKKVEGLSGDRTDIIVPGLLILHTVFRHICASHYVVSGAGLRDGLFFVMEYPESPIFPDVLDYSVRNLLALHPSVPVPHVEHVHRLASQLFDQLGMGSEFGARAKRYLQTAALLYRIGVTVHYYSYHKHTFYLMAHARIDGLTHREIVLCALIATYKLKSKSRPPATGYTELLEADDMMLVYKLGSILRLAIALDRSETQPIRQVNARVVNQELQLDCICTQAPDIELRELKQAAKDFNKVLGLRLNVKTQAFSS
ncbi:Ppx/GppA phosphatase family protein [Paenibacillus koleovorans]|uniref:Ppx/GppA phosphatase family protein n=1 Tax=Paenibacillus koleovorans TaxID=121608 RepID=UPI000FDC836D|nr:Ppx/GppA phosphatase family protein [Paenibacillus koleovorans]